MSEPPLHSSWEGREVRGRGKEYGQLSGGRGRRLSFFDHICSQASGHAAKLEHCYLYKAGLLLRTLHVLLYLLDRRRCTLPQTYCRAVFASHGLPAERNVHTRTRTRGRCSSAGRTYPPEARCHHHEERSGEDAHRGRRFARRASDGGGWQTRRGKRRANPFASLLAHAQLDNPTRGNLDGRCFCCVICTFPGKEREDYTPEFKTSANLFSEQC